MEPLKFFTLDELKGYKKTLGDLIATLEEGGSSETGPTDNKSVVRYGAGEYQAINRLLEAKMWLGQMCAGLTGGMPCGTTCNSTTTTVPPPPATLNASSPLADTTANVQETPNTTEQSA